MKKKKRTENISKRVRRYGEVDEEPLNIKLLYVNQNMALHKLPKPLIKRTNNNMHISTYKNL